jgi:mono/diheme cytochrome c family protein
MTTLLRAGAVVGAAASIAVATSGCGGSTPKPPANASPGLAAFDQVGCGSCHTLAAAHATGTVGPKLDGRALAPATVEHYVRDGGGGMPKFTNQLTDAQIKALSEFVAQSSR